MAISINGVAVPADIRDQGEYIYRKFTVSNDNGLGETVTAGLPSATWSFSSLQPSQYKWWVNTLLAGANYLRCPAVLPNNVDVEVSFSHVIVRYPTYSSRKNGIYWDVVVEIELMEV